MTELDVAVVGRALQIGKGMDMELSTDQELRSTAQGAAVQPSRYRATFVVRRA